MSQAVTRGRVLPLTDGDGLAEPDPALLQSPTAGT